MNPLAAENGARWIDATEYGLVSEATVTLGGEFSRPAARRAYLALLAHRRLDSSGRPGSTSEEWNRRVRELALHLDRRQIAAVRVERQAARPRPAGRPPIPDLAVAA